MSSCDVLRMKVALHCACEEKVGWRASRRKCAC